MDIETAELVKVAANSFLATKISFINVMAEMCEASGADVIKLADAIGIDERIGRKFLSPGLGFGGGCLPKDIRAFRATAEERGVTALVDLLTTVDGINLGRRERVLTLARGAVGGDLSGKRIAVLGAAFKPNSDDIRDSPSLAISGRLADEGAIVAVHDPVAMTNAARVRPDLRYADSVHEAAEGADLVLHLTEWADYRAIDPEALRAIVANPVLIDARCTLDAAAWRAAGWTVLVPGRPAANASTAAYVTRARRAREQPDDARRAVDDEVSGRGHLRRFRTRAGDGAAGHPVGAQAADGGEGRQVPEVIAAVEHRARPRARRQAAAARLPCPYRAAGARAPAGRVPG